MSAELGIAPLGGGDAPSPAHSISPANVQAAAAPILVAHSGESASSLPRLKPRRNNVAPFSSGDSALLAEVREQVVAMSVSPSPPFQVPGLTRMRSLPSTGPNSGSVADEGLATLQDAPPQVDDEESGGTGSMCWSWSPSKAATRQRIKPLPLGAPSLNSGGGSGSNGSSFRSKLRGHLIQGLDFPPKDKGEKEGGAAEKANVGGNRLRSKSLAEMPHSSSHGGGAATGASSGGPSSLTAPQSTVGGTADDHSEEGTTNSSLGNDVNVYMDSDEDDPVEAEEGLQVPSQTPQMSSTPAPFLDSPALISSDSPDAGGDKPILPDTPVVNQAYWWSQGGSAHPSKRPIRRKRQPSIEILSSDSDSGSERVAPVERERRSRGWDSWLKPGGGSSSSNSSPAASLPNASTPKLVSSIGGSHRSRIFSSSAGRKLRGSQSPSGGGETGEGAGFVVNDPVAARKNDSILRTILTKSKETSMPEFSLWKKKQGSSPPLGMEAKAPALPPPPPALQESQGERLPYPSLGPVSSSQASSARNPFATSGGGDGNALLSGTSAVGSTSGSLAAVMSPACPSSSSSARSSVNPFATSQSVPLPFPNQTAATFESTTPLLVRRDSDIRDGNGAGTSWSSENAGKGQLSRRNSSGHAFFPSPSASGDRLNPRVGSRTCGGAATPQGRQETCDGEGSNRPRRRSTSRRRSSAHTAVPQSPRDENTAAVDCVIPPPLETLVDRNATSSPSMNSTRDMFSSRRSSGHRTRRLTFDTSSPSASCGDQREGNTRTKVHSALAYSPRDTPQFQEVKADSARRREKEGDNGHDEDGVLSANESFGEDSQWVQERISKFSEGPADTAVHIQWKRGEQIGEGTFGKVYLGLNEMTGELFAVKQICLLDGGEDEIATLEAEINVMKCLNHCNIVRYVGTDRGESHLYIFLEYVVGGSIATMLKQFGVFKEDLIRRFTYQILLGVSYLHSNRIIHRDIKGANVLVTEQGIAKLADFGCSKQLQGMRTQSFEESLQAIRGSVPWMAPEVIKQTGHGRSADIWSIGATMIEMASANRPWPSFTNNLATMFHVATSSKPPPIPSTLSSNASNFCSHCLQIDPEARWKAEQLLEHPFLRGVKEELLNTSQPSSTV